MSLLTIIQNAATKIGVLKPNSVIGNTNQEIIELLAFAAEECRELVKRHNWQALRKEHTFLTTASEQQPALPADFSRFVDETFWNRTRKHMLNGPMTAQQWQYTKNWSVTPVTDSFTVRGNKILVAPAPQAGEIMAYEYISKYIVVANDGTEKSEFTLDTDTTALDECLIELGAIARFKLSKGLDSSSDIAKYETQLQLYISQESPKGIVSMANLTPRYSIPNIIVQDGSWGI